MPSDTDTNLAAIRARAEATGNPDIVLMWDLLAEALGALRNMRTEANRVVEKIPAWRGCNLGDAPDPYVPDFAENTAMYVVTRAEKALASIAAKLKGAK